MSSGPRPSLAPLAALLVTLAVLAASARASPIKEELEERERARRHAREVAALVANLRDELDATNDRLAERQDELVRALATDERLARSLGAAETLLVSCAFARSHALRSLQSELEAREDTRDFQRLARDAFGAALAELRAETESALRAQAHPDDQPALDKFAAAVGELLRREYARIVGEPAAE